MTATLATATSPALVEGGVKVAALAQGCTPAQAERLAAAILKSGNVPTPEYVTSMVFFAKLGPA